MTEIKFELYDNLLCDVNHKLFLDVDDVIKTLLNLKDYGKKNNMDYFPIFLLSDVSKVLKFDELCLRLEKLNINFGFSLTLDDKFFNYDKVLSLDCIKRVGNLFEIILNPIKLENEDYYVNNVINACKLAPKLHLKILLTNDIINKYSPERLYELLNNKLEKEYDVSLSFPQNFLSIEEVVLKKYSIKSPIEYIIRFYNMSEMKKKYIQNQIELFKNSLSDYKYFLSQSFYIDSKKNIYVVNYSMWNDFVDNNKHKSLYIGNLNENKFDELFKSNKVLFLDKKNSIHMHTNQEYDCHNCIFNLQCTSQGVGNLRSIYKDFEKNIGSCYGPIKLIL